MDSDLEFERLVRQTGILFQTNTGRGLEEWVLAIAKPDLGGVQVATADDLEAAGYVHHSVHDRARLDRDRLHGLLREAETFGVQLVEDKQALLVRAGVAEVWRQAEQEGILARNEGIEISHNPYGLVDAREEAGRQAWEYGWRTRDALLRLNERVSQLSQTCEEQRAQLHAAQETVHRQSGTLAAQQHTLDSLKDQIARLGQMEALFRFIWQEAPHGAQCPAWSNGPCNCWRVKVAGH